MSSKTVGRKFSNKKDGTMKIAEAPVEATESIAEAPKRKKKSKRKSFAFATAVAGDKSIPLDENGRLTLVPTNWESNFAPLKRSHFSEPALYHEWRASILEGRIQRLQSEIDTERKTAEELRSGGTPTASKIAKAKKLQRQLAELEKLLAEQGISLD